MGATICMRARHAVPLQAIILSELLYFVRQAQHQNMHALPAGLDDNIRDLLIKRIALMVQLRKFCMRISGLQQRPITIMPCALP